MLPATPSRPRYPHDLGQRPPLHRYETLEDLLREAGYKETRIFTPEIERRAEPPGVVGVVVAKLFSTLMSKRVNVPPGSPLARRTPQHHNEHEPQPQSHASPSSSTRTIRPLNLNTHGSKTSGLRHTASAPHISRTRTRTRTHSRARHPPPPSTWLSSLFAPPPRPSPTAPHPRPHRRPTLPAPAPRSSVALSTTTVLCRPARVGMLVCEEQHARGDLDLDDDDDDEGELDLARMLIPAKRQHSIRSLRSVLQRHPHLHHHIHSTPGRRRRRAEEGEEGWEEYVGVGGKGKRRRNQIPTWVA